MLPLREGSHFLCGCLLFSLFVPSCGLDVVAPPAVAATWLVPGLRGSSHAKASQAAFLQSGNAASGDTDQGLIRQQQQQKQQQQQQQQQQQAQQAQRQAPPSGLAASPLDQMSPDAQQLPATPTAVSPAGASLPDIASQDATSSRASSDPSAQASPAQASQAMVQTVDDRIDADGREISLIAQELTDVQDQFRQVEQESLSKVFDLGSMKTFFENQKAAVARNGELSKEYSRLVGQVSALTNQLDVAKQQIEAQDAAYQQQAATLKSKIQQGKALAEQKVVRLHEQKKTDQENLAMQEANRQLGQQNALSKEALHKVLVKLSQVKAQYDLRVNYTAELQEKYDTERTALDQCEGEMSATKKALEEAIKKELEEKYRLQRLEAEAKEAFLKGEAENALLKRRLEKAKANTVTIQGQVVKSTEKLGALQATGQAELSKLKASLSKIASTSASMEAKIVLNKQAKLALDNEIKELEKEVETLQARLASGELAAVRANNTRLKEELGRAQAHLHAAKVSIAAATDRQAQALQQKAVFDKESERLGAKASKAATEAVAQVTALQQQAADAAARAEQLTMLAQSLQITECDSLWDKDHPQVLADLDSCKTLPDDIQAATAQVASLSSMTAAQADQEKAEDQAEKAAAAAASSSSSATGGSSAVALLASDGADGEDMDENQDQEEAEGED